MESFSPKDTGPGYPMEDVPGRRLTLDGVYDCIDRIILNAYCPMLLVAGGVRNWYRIMEGSDKDMCDANMMRYAGRFSRRVQSFCKKNEIPFVQFQTGERKHEEAERLTGKTRQSGSSSYLGINAQHFIVNKYLIFNNITY